ncbi:MAG: type III polyketide synthase [Candidatus Eremiobacteraeota bacterium]|nr:type III polyketide synthase [Candidatus Eremiobacteraeota bacterium]MBV8432971.1 type III polyketide synthase [Candidatus Eremiobacteraeota bacterium]MBV8721565.1 type III polyketide synthase [Candidatus Eremiobacteraeota bacterium]
MVGNPARIASIATAVPPFALDQHDIVRRVELALGPRSREIVRMLPMFGNAGIERRYSCVPIEWYERTHDWPERNRIYLDSAVGLLERATRDALDAAGRKAEEIDAIVAVSTTGIATPSLDALLMERMGLRRDIARLPIFGLGCGGGTIGLARAATMAQSKPGSLVLLLVVELCALCFRRDDFSKSNIVATALFGDGAAAALLSTDLDGPAIVGGGEWTWPQSLDVMGWDVTEDGLKAIFSRDIPDLVTTELHDVAVGFLADRGLALCDIDRFVCHPGGAKVLDALEIAYELEPGALSESRDVLRDYGNMSAATVMFVLDRALHNGASHWRRALVSALGPGFTAGFTLLENPLSS